MTQQEITPVNFVTQKTITETGSHSFIPPPITPKDLTHRKSDSGQQNYSYLMKKSEIIKPVCRPPPNISRQDSGHSPHVGTGPTMFKHVKKSSSREDNSEDLEICQFLKKDKNKLL